ncbi:SCO7613 C-terminal domain-containing membrane protein [Micromonospora sp. NBC_00421]|uniref:SCO7613 C-terminal domain-containing membrane protein n=1 Tax=Micromonospora sp. NBC_00421 TaxID=2975976 RepID=UPI002E1E6671
MENTGYPCPRCGAPAELTRGCVRCGLGPYPPAAEVVRLDREIVTLGREVERAREAYQGVGARLLAAQRQRAELAARIRREIPAPTPVGAAAPPALTAAHPVAPAQAVRPPAQAVHPPAPGARPAAPAGRPVVPVPRGGVVAPGGQVPPAGSGNPSAPGRPETSTRTIQWLLFVLGGLLLGTAAVVFTAVAWATVGVAGRALILAAFTALALAVPLVARWRGLRGTAETFAAVGLLLVVLDGYAAWSVNLLGTADWPGTRYAALVGGVSAAVATGYALLSRLTVPWFAALLVVQPVLPLAAAQSRPGATGWTLVFLGVALLDLAVVVALRRRSPAPAAPAATGTTGPVPGGPNPAAPVPAGALPPGSGPAAPGPEGAVVVPAGGAGTTTPRAGEALAGSAAVLAGRVFGWLGFGAAVTVAASCALVPLALGRAAGQPLLAGLPLLLVGVVLAGAARAAGARVFRQLTAGLLVPLVAAALLRPVAELRAGFLLLAVGLVAAGLAGAVRLLPQRHRIGPRVGALLVAGGAAQVGLLASGAVAALAVDRSLPAWRGAAAGPDLSWGWQLPLAVLFTVGAGVLLLPRAARPVTVLLGAVVTAAALPAVTVTPWPATLAVDLVVGAALLPVAVLRARRTPTVLVGAGGAAVLLGHGLLVASADPVGLLVALGVVLAVGLAVALPGRPVNAVAGRVAGVALTVALLTVPAGAAVALRAAGSPPWWQLRAGFAAAVLLMVPLLALRRRRPALDGYAGTALAVALAAVVTPAVVPGGESAALYAALALVALVLADRRTDPVTPGRVVGVGLAGCALVASAPVALTALFAPYGGPVRPWSGAPTGDGPPGAAVVGVALLTLALAAALIAHRHTGGRSGPVVAALPFGAAALPVLLLAGPVPWPVVPAAVLLVGVAALLIAALAGTGVPVTTPVGLLWTGAGLVGLLATRAGTLAGLALLVVTAAVVGAVGRWAGVRLLGCLTTVAAATCFALTAPLAAGLPTRTAGFPVLGVAVAVLLGTPLLARRGPLTVRALEAAAQAVAVLALLLTVGAIRHAAVICVLWGAAAALRVLYPGRPAGRRWVFAVVAGGSELLGAWLLLISGEVVLLEAYTLPAAGLTLVAGLLALRTRPGLTSWLALGPGLAAGLLPSLVSVLVAADPQPVRRLLLGAAALGVVLVGATRRWQAPVVLGGGSLVLLALHELVRGWDLLPRWIYLAVGGLTLITLAATYERRRRDVTRLRAAVGRMG